MNYELEIKKGGAEYENMKNSIIDDLRNRGYETRKDIAKAAKAELEKLLKPCKVKKGGSKEIIPMIKAYAEIYKDIIQEYSKKESKEDLQKRFDHEDMMKAVNAKKRR